MAGIVRKELLRGSNRKDASFRHNQDWRLDAPDHPHNRSAFEAHSNIVTALELAFAKKSLRQLCESETKAKRDLGVRMAEKLRRRLADLRAATCVKDLVAGRPRELDGADHRHIAIDLCEDYRIIFCANHTANPVVKSGDVDWSRVSRVKILRIERDYGSKQRLPT